jgi:hypothetical protein
VADNIAITAGSGTTVATDDIGSGVQVQRVKPVWGADGIGNDTQVALPLPVQTTMDVSQVSSLGTIATPQFAVINTSASGDTTLVAAVTSKVIRVLSYVLVADSAVAAKFTSGPAGTAITGAMSLAANGGVAAPFSPVGHFQTAANTALVLNLGAAIGARGHLTYVAV